MALIVQKFGGSSVANAEKIFNVAGRVTETYDNGNSVIVVVSAMGDTTDELIEKAMEINPKGSKREMDMLLSTGEQVTISLLAMAIEKMGYPVVSLTGWQIGMKTDSHYSNARIHKIDSERIHTELDKNRIVIVAGFQGINKYDDITTLGRGGSDTTAVAIAAAMHADLCEIYTDVDGVYTADPRFVKNAYKLDDISFNIPNGSDYMKDWTFTSSDGRFEMTFKPVIDRAARISLKVIETDQHQVFGRMSGKAVLDSGEVLEIKDVMCFAEKVRMKY